MSVNNNTNIPAKNSFVNLDSLKNANLTENEKAVLSKCDYADFKTKWENGLNNISGKPNIRNVKEAKEGVFRRLGAATGFIGFEPWKQSKQIFSDWRSFDSYVRFDIKSETYQKIAKANPQYFDKVIEHLEQVADELDGRADIRIGTFCSHQSGETLAMLASNFRSTAAWLRLKMKEGENIKQRNNNERPEADRRQPTVINHYHNHIGHIGDINIGHLGNKNFYNKNGNVFMPFNGNPNNIRHAGSEPVTSMPKLQNSYYSPVINGVKLLELEPGNAVKFLGQGNKNKGKPFEIQRNGELTFEAEKTLPKESDSKNFEQQTIESMRFVSEEPKNVEKTDTANRKGAQDSNTNILNDIKEERTAKTDLETYVKKPKGTVKTYIKPRHVSQQQQSRIPEEALNIHSVKPEKNSSEAMLSELTNLRDKYYRLWDKIHQDKNPKNANTSNNNSIRKKLNIFDKNNHNQIKDSDNSFEKLSKLGRQIRELNKTLETLEQNREIDQHRLSTVSPMLNQIAQVIDGDKKEVLKGQKAERTGKSDLAGEQHGLSWDAEVKNKTVSEEEQKMSPDETREHLVEETQKVLDRIQEQLGIRKENDNKTDSRLKSQSGVKSKYDKTKNLRRTAVETTKNQPFDRKKMEAYDKNVVTKNNENMKKEAFDPSKTRWMPNGVQKTADNENYKTYNANVTDPLFHRHSS